MSLVDYASSDSDDGEEDLPVQAQDRRQSQAPNDEPTPSTLAPPPSRNPRAIRESSQNHNHSESAAGASAPPSVERLPDASLLLNSIELPSHVATGGDHSSRVAAAMIESASRKREANGSASSSFPRSKIPRGALPPSRNTPDTGGGLLLPPQLRGRSNVVTEDISRLFVRRQSMP